jgi:hypothetical protein
VLDNGFADFVLRLGIIRVRSDALCGPLRLRLHLVELRKRVERGLLPRGIVDLVDDALGLARLITDAIACYDVIQ